MTFSTISYLAVFIAAVASMAVGAGWYTVLANTWMDANKFDDVQREIINKNEDKSVYGIAALCQLVLAFFLAGLIGHMGEVTISNALTTAFFVWLGFIVPTMVVNHRFGFKTWSLTLIDAGHWLAVLLVQAIVIALIT